jgi:glycosyltransferase involved in cell wall biosynthesis
MLDSIIAQKVNFKYQIYIGNDGSDDGTVKIIEQYKKRYPDQIQLFITDRVPRKFSGDYLNFHNLFKCTKSEYFCVLDGDDYWIDSHKLQKQINFLDSHNEFTVCGHDYFILDQHGNLVPSKDDSKDQYYKFYCDNFEEALWGGSVPYPQTSSVLFRNVFKNDVKFQNYFLHHMFNGDFPRYLLHAKVGKVKYINEKMSVYRNTGTGVWTSRGAIQNHLLHINFFKFHRDNTFSKEYSKFFDKAIMREYLGLLINEPQKINRLIYFFIFQGYKIKFLFCSFFKNSKIINNS